jgi:hypothetical protein
MAQVYRTQLFTWVYFAVRLLATLVIITQAVLLVIPVLTLIHQADSPSSVDLFQMLVYGLGLSVAIFLDHIYSMVLASLVGMVAPTFARHGAESRLRAVATFAGLQLAAYVTAGGCAVVVFPAAIRLLHLDGWSAHASLTAAAVVAFVVIREAIIALYWRHLAHQLNMSQAEFDLSAYQNV